MYRLYCRAFQSVIKAANYFLGYRAPEYIQGVNAVESIVSVVQKNELQNLLIVTGPNIYKRGLTDSMLCALKQKDIAYTVFCDIGQNPNDVNVEAGLDIYHSNRCQAIIAFGGGAAMDCAKAIAARVTQSNKSIAQLHGLLKIHKKTPVIVAIPTTSGSGSEATLAAVITDTSTHRKASINDPVLIPDYVILDPALTVKLPAGITATTGMDALCHAVEAYTNHFYNTSFENSMAKESVRLIHKSLLKAYYNGNDMEARQDMQLAAFYAGLSFTRGCVGYVHAIGHTLGGLYQIPHGSAMGIILPHVLKQYGSAVYRRLSELADVCGISGCSAQEKAEAFIRWIEDLKTEMDIPYGVSCILEEDIPTMVHWAKKEANPLYPVPVIWKKRDFFSLIESIRKVGNES